MCQYFEDLVNLFHIILLKRDFIRKEYDMV